MQRLQHGGTPGTSPRLRSRSYARSWTFSAVRSGTRLGAALLAARRGEPAVGMAELEEAIDRVSMGLERRSRVISPEKHRRLGYHELGHALVAMGCPHADPVHRVSIVPRGVSALSVTQQLPADDRHLISQPELEDRLAAMMGGRAAEQVVFKEISSGAANDLQQATANFLEQDGRLEARALRLIAEILLEREALEGPELKKLLEDPEAVPELALS
jgi:hypothetical protein